MRRIVLATCGLLLVVLCSSWGFFAHYRIGRLAVFTLPKGMSNFYKANIDYITEHAVAADKRRYVDSTEAPRHFLDADHYGKKPFAAIPQNWDDVVKKYTADTLYKYGTVPWTIVFEYYHLVKVFKAHDTTGILNTSANLGHYVADAHVPLHLTMNYNGQLTGQTGIHAFWESRVPELFGNQWNYYVGKARYIDDPLKEAFRICRSSYAEVDSVLRFEHMLDKTFPHEKKYVTIKRDGRKVQEYSEEYSRAYMKMLNGMIQRRMRSSILSVGSFWFSAWVDAGQPDLDKLIAKRPSAKQKAQIDKEDAAFKAGKIITNGKY